MAVPRNNNLSEFIKFISIGGGGGGSELESRSDTFKMIDRDKLVDTN